MTIAQITIAQIPNYCAEDSSCESLTLNLGTIGDYVWEDTNGNGLQDDGATGVEGVTVNLLDGSGNPIGAGYTTTTGTDGFQRGGSSTMRLTSSSRERLPG